MKLLLSIFVVTLLLSCDQPDEQVFLSPEEIRADSLRNYADSIAELRRLHSLFSGRHVHAPGSDLAQAAHQNIPGKRRMRTVANRERESRAQAAAFHAERVAVALKESEN